MLVASLVAINLLVSCYQDKSKEHDALADPGYDNVVMTAKDSAIMKRHQDSISFTTTHHYSNNYNFSVKSDSMSLYVQRPEEIVSRGLQLANDQVLAVERTDTDSIMIYRGERLVVAQILILPTDTIDSVWVQLARDQSTFGWTRESKLLKSVVPDDPISQFIDLFSNVHLLWTLIVVGLALVAYVFNRITRHRAKIVHFNDISSFYPTALVLDIALAAVTYATIQMYYPEMWRHFYYHTTLNPLSVPLILSVFLTLVWLMPILGVAAVDDVRRHLSINDGILYLCGLAAVCLVDYVVFSLSTLYFVGYPLFVFYVFFSIHTFNKHRRLHFFCGKCGRAILHKGVCPYCGANNV